MSEPDTEVQERVTRAKGEPNPLHHAPEEQRLDSLEDEKIDAVGLNLSPCWFPWAGPSPGEPLDGS